RSTPCYLRDRTKRVGVVGHHAALLCSAAANSIAVQHTVDALTTGSICVEGAHLTLVIFLQQIILTQHLAACPAFHCRLLAFADYYPAHGLGIVYSRDYRLFDKPFATAFGTKNRLRFGLAYNEQAYVMASWEVAVCWQQIITVLV